MALGLSTGSGSGDIRPFVKYDAKAGRLFRIDRAQNASGMFESNQVDITRDAAFIIDLAGIKVGWINYTSQGPIKRLVVLGQEAVPPRPSDVNSEGKPAFKQGFEVALKLGNSIQGPGGGVARDMSSTAGCVIEAVDALHDAFSASPESKEGKLPVVKLVDTIPVKSGQSTNYKPIFEIVSWKDRPEELPLPSMADAPASTTPAPAASSPPVTGSTQAEPPAAQAPQPATAGADDFG